MTNRIKLLRKKKGITVKDLAETLGVSQSMMTNYENGSSTPRSQTFWIDLANYFGVSTGYLMGITDTVDETVPSGTCYLPFFILDTESIQERFIKTAYPVEIGIETPEQYALLANISQLPHDEIIKLLEHVQGIIREQYAGRLTEIKLPE